MTKLRALKSALVCGAVCLAIGPVAHAAEQTIELEGTMSEVSNSCVGAVTDIVLADCTYNGSESALTYFGPLFFARFYETGTSPFEQDPGNLPAAPVPDDGAQLPVTGSLTFNTSDASPCSGSDTVEGYFVIGGGTRAFTGGQAEWAEEVWTDGTVRYDLVAEAGGPITPDIQNDLGGGACEYIIGGDASKFPSFPQLITTVGGLTFPADANTFTTGPPPSVGPGDDPWTGPEPNGIGIGGREGASGVPISLNEDAFAAGSWSCLDYLGNSTSGPDGCSTINSSSSTCQVGGQNYCGTNRTQENWQVRIVVSGSGQLQEGSQVIAVNDYQIFSPDDSWDATVINFKSPEGVAVSDTYTIVTSTTLPLDLPIGGNDDPLAILDTNATTLTLDGDDPIEGRCGIVGSDFGPGDVKTFICAYDAPAGFQAPFADTFTYTLDDGTNPDPELGLQTTVSVDIVEDTAPAANPFALQLDARGVDPATISEDVDVVADIAGNSGGNQPSVSDNGSAQFGTVTITGATTLTYTVSSIGAGRLLAGTPDSFGYTITDGNFFGGTPEEASSLITVTIAPADPIIPPGGRIGPVEPGSTESVSTEITLGNGSVDQHSYNATCNDGAISITSVTADEPPTAQVNGEYTAPEVEGEVICSYTVRDAEGDVANGLVIIDVKSGEAVNLPGAGSAIGPAALALLLTLIPLLRSRVSRRRAIRAGAIDYGVK